MVISTIVFSKSPKSQIQTLTGLACIPVLPQKQKVESSWEIQTHAGYSSTL